MQPIETMTKKEFEELAAAANEEGLKRLRVRCINIYCRYFQDNTLEMAKDGETTVDRLDLLEKYRILRRRLRHLAIRHSTSPIDVALFKRGMLGVETRAIEELVVVENFISIGGSYAKAGPQSAQDIDVIIREEDRNRNEGLELKVGRQIQKFTEKDPHFVYSPTGPHSTYIPLYDLVLRRRARAERVEIREILTKAGIQPGRSFTPLKTRGGYGELEFADKDVLWTTWAQGYIPDPGVAVETKYDGFRIQIHLTEGGVKILSEDAKRDLAPRTRSLTEELSSYPKPAVLDGELILFDGKEKVRRQDMPTYLAESHEGAFRSTAEIFDILWWGGKALNAEPWTSRQEALNAFFGKVDEKDVHRVKPTIAKSKDAFLQAVEAHAAAPDSEGAMCKVVNSDYPLDGKTSEWAKFKNFKSLIVKVTEREAKEGGGFIYTCEIGEGAPIGRTYATKLDAKVGDILEVAAAEIKYDEETGAFTWDNPIVRETKAPGTALTTPAQAKALAQIGRTRKDAAAGESNITLKEGDKGEGIAQLHIMGLKEEEATAIKAASKRLILARSDIGKLRVLLKGILGAKGAHIDMRLRPQAKNFWEGNEIFVGNLDGLDKLEKLRQENQKLRADWKRPHADEPEGAIQGPLGWMEAGDRQVEIFPPGEPGATSNTYGIMLRLDKYTWELYQADAHAKKFHFEGGRIFNGNFLFAFVPVEGGRVWMLSRLDDKDNLEAVNKKLTEVERRDIERENEEIRQNKETITYPHKFKAAKWTHGNGHPRCIHCGQEEPITRVCRKPTRAQVRKMSTELDQDPRVQAKKPALGLFEGKEGAYFRITKTDKPRQVVGGIVYEPGAPQKTDTQGDWTSADEITKAIEIFMLRYAASSSRIRVNHKGKAYTFPIIECFQPEEPTRKGAEVVPAGAWWLMVKITEPEIWKMIEKGELTGFSLGGTARA